MENPYHVFIWKLIFDLYRDLPEEVKQSKPLMLAELSGEPIVLELAPVHNGKPLAYMTPEERAQALEEMGDSWPRTEEWRELESGQKVRVRPLRKEDYHNGVELAHMTPEERLKVIEERAKEPIERIGHTPSGDIVGLVPITPSQVELETDEVRRGPGRPRLPDHLLKQKRRKKLDPPA